VRFSARPLPTHCNSAHQGRSVFEIHSKTPEISELQSALITGGAGFIGSHLSRRLLDAGVHVVVMDDLSTGTRANVPAGAEFEAGDVCDADLVGKLAGGVDVIYHLAAVASVQKCHDQIAACHRTNSLGVASVIEAARNVSVKPAIVFASSAAVYGAPLTLPLKEDAHVRPSSFYGADKAAGETQLRLAASLFGLNSVIFRLFNVFGPNQSRHSEYAGVISIFADAMLQRAPITIFGDGQQIRDFVYVRDVADHFFIAGKLACGSVDGTSETLNVCSGHGTSVNDLFSMLAEETQYPLEPTYGPARVGDIRMSLGDPTTAQARLGITCSRTMSTGIREFCSFLGQKSD
jgi:UDP-glucose 4-epimerase